MTVVMRRFEYNNKLNLKKKSEKKRTIDEDILDVIHTAATKIQACSKGFFVRNILRKNKLFNNSAIFIQSYLKKYIQARKMANIQREIENKKRFERQKIFSSSLGLIIKRRIFRNFTNSANVYIDFKLKKYKEFEDRVSIAIPILIIILKRKIFNEIKIKLKQKIEYEHFIKTCNKREKAIISLNNSYHNIRKNRGKYQKKIFFNWLITHDRRKVNLVNHLFQKMNLQLFELRKKAFIRLNKFCSFIKFGMVLIIF